MCVRSAVIFLFNEEVCYVGGNNKCLFMIQILCLVSSYFDVLFVISTAFLVLQGKVVSTLQK